MTAIQTLLEAHKPYLTDGGMETWLFFQQGFEAPAFAAITLMEDADARARLAEYFDGFLAMAERAGTGFVLDTNTWRGCVEWAPELGMTTQEVLRLSGEAVRFARGIRDKWLSRVPDILVNGVIGPAGDGYSADMAHDAAWFEAAHTPQIRVLAEAGVDMISALTMTGTAEAIGVVRAARQAGLPVVISFTVETDGRLPSGATLEQAIADVDGATAGGAAYYMVNCAHPEHFRERLAGGEAWIARIGGVRANASRMSHEELDNSEVLDQGDPEEFGALHAELARLLPGLRVVGGCCGTDHRHVSCVSRHLHLQPA